MELSSIGSDIHPAEMMWKDLDKQFTRKPTNNAKLKLFCKDGFEKTGFLGVHCFSKSKKEKEKDTDSNNPHTSMQYWDIFLKKETIECDIFVKSDHLYLVLGIVLKT